MSDSRPPRRRGFIKKAVIITLTSVLIVGGLLVGGVRLLDTFAPQYRNALAARIGQRLGADIQISGLALGWSWQGPVLYLDDLRVTQNGQQAPVLKAERLGLRFSVSDLLHGARLPDGVLLDDPQLGLEQKRNGRLGLVHWSGTGKTRLDWQQIDQLRRQLRTLAISNGQIAIASPRLPGGQTRLQKLSFRLNTDVSGSSDQGTRSELSLSALGPIWWPQVQATAEIRGALPRPDQATINARASGLRPLVLASRSDLLPDAMVHRLSGGVANLTLNGNWQNRHLQDSHATLALTPVRDRRRSSPLLPALTAVINADSDADARHIRFNLERLTSANEKLTQVQAKATLDTRDRTLQASAQDLPGELAARLALLGLPELSRANVALAIDNVKLQAGADQPTQLAFGFHGLRIDDAHLAAGPIAGRYVQKDGLHQLLFSQAGGQLKAPRYLNGTLAISDLDGGVRWQRKNDGLHIGIDKLRLASHEAEFTANGNVLLPEDGAPIVDLKADMSAPNVARLLARIPQAPDLPNPKLRDWLPKAITHGVLDKAQLSVRGSMDRFPFAQPKAGEGFHLQLTGHDVDVTYKEDWPALRQARGTLTLDGDTLDLALAQARMLDFTIDQAQAHVPDVREPIMQVKGQAHNARAPDLLAFLTQSPLRQRFGKLVKALDLQGRDDLNIDLSIPLKPGLGDVQVSGRVNAHQNRLTQSALPGPITNIDGQVRFDRQGLSASNLHGRLLGVPLTASLAPASGNQQRIVAQAQPTLPKDRAALAHYLPVPWLDYGQGQTNIRVAFTIGAKGDVSPITVDSQLKGLAVTLPAPLTKPAGRAAPLSVLVDTARDRIHADYDNQVQLAIRMKDGTPTRIQARINDDQMATPDRDGVWIGGQADQVDAIGWFNVVRNVLYGDTSSAEPRQTTPTSTPDSLAFLGGDLQIGRLSFGDRYFPNTHVRADPMAGVHGWRVNLEGDATQGQITWQAPADGRMALAGNLKRLALSTQTEPDAKPTSTPRPVDDSPVIWPELSPLNLPGMQLYVQHFVVDDTDFGQTHVDATPMDNGWRLDRFQLSDGALVGHAKAQWQVNQGVTQAGVSAKFDGYGLSHLLRSAGYQSPVRSKQAKVRGTLDIAPNANGLDLRYLNGDVHLALQQGSLLSIEPGPGRLLGLFNLYVLPRRLLLDFRDVVDKGMAFDQVHADFDIRQGQAYSDNLEIKTPSSNINIDGRIGLATRDYDEHVRISPKLGSGVAIASAVLGGPIVGAAVFAVQELLKKPIQHFSSIGYTLKGSWDDPQIIDPSAQN